jgi:hypothetical protein
MNAILRRLAAVALVAGTMSALPADAAQGVLPEVLLVVDTSQSMQYRVGADKLPLCSMSSATDQKSRWTLVREIVGGSFASHQCKYEALPAMAESLTPPKQLFGAPTCIGGLKHYLGPAYTIDAYTSVPAGQFPSGTAHFGSLGVSLNTTARTGEASSELKVTTLDVPFFHFDLTPVTTTEPWIEGSVSLFANVNTLVSPGAIYSLVLAYANPQPQPNVTVNGTPHACAVSRAASRTVLSDPVPLLSKGPAKLKFTLTEAGLADLNARRKAGQNHVYLTLAPATARFNGANCTLPVLPKSAITVDVVYDTNALSPVALRPTLALQAGKLCPGEGPAQHSVAQGVNELGLYVEEPVGKDGLIDMFGPSAKFALLAGDHALSMATTAPGGFSYAQPLSTLWGDANHGMADPALVGSPSVPMTRPDDMAARQATYKQIQDRLKTLRPNGPTPLATQLQDVVDYIGPGPFMDPHFKSTVDDPVNGDPYRQCRRHIVALISDGGSNLYGGTTDGRAAAIAAAAKLYSLNVPVHVLAVGHPADGGAGPPAADLDFLSQVAAAGGTLGATIAKSPADAMQALSGAIAAANVQGEVLTRPILSSATGTKTDVLHAFHAISYFDISQPLRTRGVIEQRIFRCDGDCKAAETPNRANVCEVIDYHARLRDRVGPRRKYSHRLGSRILADKNNLTATELGIGTVGIAPKLQLVPPGLCATTGGYNLSKPEERDGYRDHVLETLVGAKSSCREKHPLGATARSQAAVLEPADRLGLREPSFQIYAKRTVPASANFSDLNPPGSAGRPTMLFAATHDGLLHAFRSDRNPKIGTADNAVAGDEMWAFLPRFNLTRISNMKLVTEAPASFLGGSVTTAHALLKRTSIDVKAAAKEWRAVVIVGAGEAGSGYMALDVTSPDDPRLLWEISPEQHCWGSGSVSGVVGPMCLKVKTFQAMGRSTSRAVITTLFYRKDGLLGERSVAVIPLGKAPAEAETSNIGAEGLGARGVIVVDLETGELIRQWLTTDIDAGKLGAVDPTKLGNFWADAACFNGAPGQVATRCFFGDSKGVVWRADFASTEPLEWSVAAFFDAYSGPEVPAQQNLAMANPDRVPVLSAPSLAMRVDGKLNIVFGTGGVDYALSATQRSLAYSLREKLTPKTATSDAKVESFRNWVKTLALFERFAGPATTFGGNGYFATYTVAADSLCELGNARVWGVRFDRPKTPSDPTDLQGAFPNPSKPSSVSANLTYLDLGAYKPSPAFIAQVPACRGACAPGDTQCIAATGGLISPDKPRYEIGIGVAGPVQGKNQTPKVGPKPQVGTVTRELPSPRTAVVLTGWDLLLE